MVFYSTLNRDHTVNAQTAIMEGMPQDKGLYMPQSIPKLPTSFIDSLPQLSFPEIAEVVANALLGDDIPAEVLNSICEEAFSFSAPLVNIEPNTYCLELFHGPTLAFKDFGARFMARVMSYFNRNETKQLTILVATSGDTGGAVAAGFYKTPGIRVVILYPSGKVSPLQEKQLTTLGENITALEIDGSFDDCQALVKQAFIDTDITAIHRLSSANSINIARLIPQSFYYFEAWKQLPQGTATPNAVFAVPSGNFGNLCSGIIAQQMGLPIAHFIAATNVNDVVPDFLSTGIYQPRPSVETLSNAMDVGAPSNFYRLWNLFSEDLQHLREDITGYKVDDTTTVATILDLKKRTGYLTDPHGAVAYYALKAYLAANPSSVGVFLGTAHPAKFKETMEDILQQPLILPEALADLVTKPKTSHPLSADFSTFKQWLLALPQ